MELLQMIKKLVRGVEVRGAGVGTWRDAILAAYKVFRQLNQNNGGKVMLNLPQRKFEYIEN